MVVDILTKALPHGKFESLACKLGIFPALEGSVVLFKSTKVPPHF